MDSRVLRCLPLQRFDLLLVFHIGRFVEDPIPWIFAYSQVDEVTMVDVWFDHKMACVMKEMNDLVDLMRKVKMKFQLMSTWLNLVWYRLIAKSSNAIYLPEEDGGRYGDWS